MNSSGRMLRARKAALAHAKGLVLDVDAEVGAGLGMALTRRVDPPFAQRAFRGGSFRSRRCRVLGLGPPTDTNPEPGRRDVHPIFITRRRLLVWRREVRRGRRRRRRLVLAGRARRPLVVGLGACAAHGAVPSLGGCPVSWVRFRRLPPSAAAFCNGVARGAFRPRCLGLSLPRFPGPASLSLEHGGARCLKRRRSGWYWSWGRAGFPEPCGFAG